MKYLNNYTNFRLNENAGFLTDRDQILKKLEEMIGPSERIGGPPFQSELATVHPDGTVDYEGYISIRSSPKMTKLPIKFGKVHYFHCGGVGLTTLLGCPEEVGYFGVGNNKLTDLEGFPKIVHNDINLSFNNLTTLEGLNYKKGNLILENNKLTSWKGGPNYIDGNLSVKNNLFTDFKGFPTHVDGEFAPQSNPNLTSLEGFPIRNNKKPADIPYPIRLYGLPNLFFAEKYEGDFDLQFETDSLGLDLRDEYNSAYRFVARSMKPDAPPPISQIVQLFPTVKDFFDSLDYNYFKMVDGKPAIIEWRFKQALEEFDLPFPVNPPYWKNNRKYPGCEDLGVYIYVDDSGKRLADLEGVPPWNYDRPAGRSVAMGLRDPNLRDDVDIEEEYYEEEEYYDDDFQDEEDQ